MMQQHGSSMYQNQQKIDHASILIYLKQITNHFISQAENNANQEKLMRCHDQLVDVLMRIWSGIDQGTIRVDCKAMLRTICNITCPDILAQISSTNYNRDKLVRELRLLLNTMNFIF